MNAPEDPPRLRNDCFALPPGVAWTPVDEALAALRARCACVAGVESVPLAAAYGRILAAPVAALRPNPPRANSAVDGWAFAHAALTSADPERLVRLPGRAVPGADGPAVPSGAALRILTGAALPRGADTVVLDEDVGLTAEEIRLRPGLRRGANVRPAGEDSRPDDPLLEAGRVLSPADLALAASGGHAVLPVRRRLRVAVLSTGDELADPGPRAAPEAVMDANRPMLGALAAAWGFDVIDLGRAPDRREAVTEALERGAAQADAILTSGGASAGDEDHVSAALAADGALGEWRIAMKPGRPLALGVWNGAAVFGLPGNPVAAFVCALIFARPALLALAGAGWREPAARKVPAAFAKRRKPGRREYLRARLTPGGAAEVFPSEGSGRVSGLSWATGLVELPDEGPDIAPGDPVRWLPFSAFGLSGAGEI